MNSMIFLKYYYKIKVKKVSLYKFIVSVKTSEQYFAKSNFLTFFLKSTNNVLKKIALYIFAQRTVNPQKHYDKTNLHEEQKNIR